MLRRGRLRAPGSLLVITSLGLLAAAQAPVLAATPSPTPKAASAATTPDTVTAECATPTAKNINRCFALRVTNGTTAAKSVKGLMTTAAPAGLSPNDLTSAYKLPANGGAGATIAVVDVYDDPNAATDLAM